MPNRVKIVTKLNWPSFRNVATEVCKQLARRCSCTISDWSRARPGGKTIVIGTVDPQTLKHIECLVPKSDIVFYATTEGLSRLNRSDLVIAEQLRIVAVSKFVKEMLEQIRVPVAGVLHHGIDMSNTSVDDRFYRKLRTKYKDRKIILTVSANHSRKGLDKLLRAFRVVEKHVPDAFLILHSQRRGHYDLERQAKSLGITRLWLTNKFGLSTPRQLNALYRLCTVYVQPSLSEGFGLPIVEALRFNKAAIAVDAPPFSEIIRHGKTGMLLPLRGVSWSDYEGKINFKTHEYYVQDLANAIERLVTDQSLLQDLRRKTAREKWKWDARRLYPELLTYFK